MSVSVFLSEFLETEKEMSSIKFQGILDLAVLCYVLALSKLTEVVHLKSALGICCGAVDSQLVRLQERKESEQKQIVVI